MNTSPLTLIREVIERMVMLPDESPRLRVYVHPMVAAQYEREVGPLPDHVVVTEDAPYEVFIDPVRDDIERRKARP